jgi:hypothetical protein
LAIKRAICLKSTAHPRTLSTTREEAALHE